MTPPDPLRVAVVTPYHRESPAVLRACLESVAGQTHPCTHFLVADGHPQDPGPGVEHFVLPHEHRDNGNTPRAVGALSAMNRGFDAIAFLDADNWYYPTHVAAMVARHRASGAVVCTAARTIHRLDGTLLFDDRESNGEDHCDTSCLFLTRAAFRTLPVWAMMPREMGPLCDRVMWNVIKWKGYPRSHHPTPTVAFRTRYQVHYTAVGEVPPPGTVTIDETTGAAYRWWFGLPAGERDAWSRYLATIPS